MLDKPSLDVRPLTPKRMEDLGQVLKGSWGSSCWCMHPRLTEKQMRALPNESGQPEGPLGPRRHAAMQKLSRRKRAPGLIAYEDDKPVGWIAVAPRAEFARVDASRATPRIDEVDVWVIACITVAKPARGKGVALALIEVATDFAAGEGAAAVEAYPRAGDGRTGDDNAYFGTEPMFRRAGFEVVRGPIEDLPRNWLPRVTMRRMTA